MGPPASTSLCADQHRGLGRLTRPRMRPGSNLHAPPLNNQQTVSSHDLHAPPDLFTHLHRQPPL